MEKIIESFLDIMPVLKDVLQEDISVAVVDTTNFLYYRPSDTIDLHIEIGKKLTNADPIYTAMQGGKITSVIVPKEVYGVPFKSVVYPINDSQGNIIGAVATGKSLGKQLKAEEASETVFSSLQQTNASIEELSSNSQNLVSSMDNITGYTNITNEKIKKIDLLLNAIQNISSKSNLLALNAAIEAARAGDAGKGFSVVANEMKKLSVLSKDSAIEVSKTLVEIKNSIDEIIKEITSTSLMAESQSAATQEITATIEEITSSSQVLAQMTRIV